MPRKSKRLSRKKKTKPWVKKIAFIGAVFLISFLAYQTYSNHVATLNIPKRAASRQVHPPSRPLAKHPSLPKVVSGTRHSPVSLPLPLKIPEIPKGLPVRGKFWTSQPKLVFVIDDIGHNKKNEIHLKKLSNNVTYAVLPKLTYSEHFSILAHQLGAEVILHQPLESAKGIYPGPGLIKQKMNDAEIRTILEENLHSVPHFSGINNHMGSLGSSDERIMGVILKELKQRGVFFLDSRTTGNTVSDKMGPKIQLPVLRRDVFLDNVDERELIRSQVREAARIAKAHGQAIAIGHDRYHTLSVLYEEIPKLTSEGYQIVSLSDLVRHSNQ